jgi:hypothetical protein
VVSARFVGGSAKGRVGANWACYRSRGLSGSVLTATEASASADLTRSSSRQPESGPEIRACSRQLRASQGDGGLTVTMDACVGSIGALLDGVVDELVRPRTSKLPRTRWKIERVDPFVRHGAPQPA